MKKNEEKQNYVINEVVVVEGKSDTNKLKKIFNNIKTFETNGCALSKEKINLLKEINKTYGIICFLDPDDAGKKIRNKIIAAIPDAKHCFITKKDMLKKQKIGLAEASDQSIIDALANTISFTNKQTKTYLNFNQYLKLNLNTKAKRMLLCNYLKIPYYNNKQLFKILNYLKLDFEKINDILKEVIHV